MVFISIRFTFNFKTASNIDLRAVGITVSKIHILDDRYADLDLEHSLPYVVLKAV